jgi:hypothetical protein
VELVVERQLRGHVAELVVERNERACCRTGC